MKNKNPKKPTHLHIEHFFRKQYCVLAVMAFMLLAVTKSEGKLLGMVHEAYVHGFGIVGQYLREEPTRHQLAFDIARTPTISSK